MSRLQTIEIIANGQVIGTRFPYIDELRDDLILTDTKASDFNVIRWPTGASRWATLSVLMTSDDVDLLMSAINHDLTTTFTVRLNEFHEFQGMMLVETRPALISENSLVLYEVRIADDRFLWRRQVYDGFGYNVSLDDKSLIFDDTKIGGTETSVQVAVEDLLDRLGLVSDDYDTESNDQYTSDSFRDVNAQGRPIPVLIDKLLAGAGMTLVRRPNNNVSAARYRIVSNTLGLDEMANFIDAASRLLIAGGVSRSIATTDPGWSGAAQYAHEFKQTTDAEMPSSVDVHFPVALDGGSGYQYDASSQTTGLDRTVRRWHIVNSSSDHTGNGETHVIYDSMWALYDSSGTLQNSSALSSRADDVAAAYFSSWSAGSCDFVIQGVNPIVPWPGATMIEYRMGLGGAMTRVRGTPEDMVLRFDPERPIGGADIIATGSARAHQRMDGMLLIDVPPGPLKFIPVLVTSNNGGGINTTYDVEAEHSDYTASGLTPENRDSNLDYEAAVAGAQGFLVRGEDKLEEWFWLREDLDTADCEEGPSTNGGLSTTMMLSNMNFAQV